MVGYENRNSPLGSGKWTNYPLTIQPYAEALGNTNIPAEWETRAICEIMNTGISRGDIQGWQAHKTAKRYPKYGVQKGWERVTSPETGAKNFSEITDAEAKQLGFPF